MSDKHTTVQYQLRLDEKLRDKIKASAKFHNRSMNADIVDRLQETFIQDNACGGSPSGYNNLVLQYEEVLNELEELKQKYNREYGLEQFDAMKDEILNAIKSLKT